MNTDNLNKMSLPWQRLAAGIASVLIVLVLSAAGSSARAAGPTFSDDSQACVDCHGKPDIAPKVLDDGTKLSMHVAGKDFLAAMHYKQDCTDCHADLDEKTHGKVKTPLKDLRAMKASMQETCRDCHKKKAKAYDDGIHATLVKEGNDKAPYCASCHNAHNQVSVKLTAAIDKAPCANCHEKIFKAYVGDVHGKARADKGKDAPICFDCHSAHDVTAPSLGDGPKSACLECHKTAAEKHADWLPNSKLHFEAVSCVACHSPAAPRRVNLRLYDGVTDVQLREATGVPQFASRAKASDLGNVGLDEGDLSALLKQFGQDSGPKGKVILRGRLEVSSGVAAHELAPKDKALKACSTCHSQGAEPFKSVVLSIASADGRPLRHVVQQDVLGSATAFNSVRGFYALGSTRIKALDTVLVIGGLVCLVACIGHGVARGMFSGVRRRRTGSK
jgi:predicted CXXCH cytochrome family protein